MSFSDSFKFIFLTWDYIRREISSNFASLTFLHVNTLQKKNHRKSFSLAEWGISDDGARTLCERLNQRSKQQWWKIKKNSTRKQRIGLALLLCVLLIFFFIFRWSLCNKYIHSYMCAWLGARQLLRCVHTRSMLDGTFFFFLLLLYSESSRSWRKTFRKQEVKRAKLFESLIDLGRGSFSSNFRFSHPLADY